FSVSFNYRSDTGVIDITGRIHLSFFFFSVNISHTFSIGVFKLPAPIHLAGSSTNNKLSDGDVVAPDGNLYLNMGEDRSSFRSTDPDISGVTDETFIVKHISGSATSDEGETVDVTGLGRTQRFSGDKHIIAYGGSGD